MMRDITRTVRRKTRKGLRLGNIVCCAAGHPASIRVPARFPANTLAGYWRASLTGRESFARLSAFLKNTEGVT